VKNQVEKTAKKTTNQAACYSRCSNRLPAEERVVRSRHGDGGNDASRRRTNYRA
jgi:hypothetical protein